MICNLCPRQCNARRTPEAGEGFCGMGSEIRVARAALHHWEEPCISGTRGSGTIFFSGCTLQCVYCQNHEISSGRFGRDISPRRLSEIFRELEAQGAHNINLVTGTMFVQGILQALDEYTPRVPVVWNSSGYERLETLKMLDGRVQIYLPDLKYVSPALSGLLSGAKDYFEQAAPALQEMCRQSGACVYDAEGILQRGTVVRHLILPGCTTDSMRVLDFIHDTLPPDTPVSLMRQYSPVPSCTVRGMNRRITDREYKRVLDYYKTLGLSGFMQEKSSAKEEYTPPFDLTGI